MSSRLLAGPAVAAAVLATGVALVVFVDPHEPGRYPLCPFQALTRLDCPMCGGLRAAHDLATGDLVAALDDNLLVTIAFALIVLLGVRRAWRGWSGRPPGNPIGTWVWIAIAVVTVAFWVARNIPGVPFLPSGPG